MCPAPERGMALARARATDSKGVPMHRLFVGLMTLAVAALVGCTGPKGDKGDPGAAGADGAPGSAGTAGATGPTGATGATGATGTTGTTGPTGPTGPQGAQGDAGTPGSSTGSVTVFVYDALTLAYVRGAQVVASPGGEVMSTGDGGTAMFSGLPVGVHTFAVEGQALKQQGNDVVGSYLVQAPPVPVSVRAASQTTVAVALPRIWAQDFNLVALHTKLPSNNLLFKNANCTACHGSRNDELARDGTSPSFHMRHSAQTCTASCHGTVDLLEESGAHLRKQVSPDTACLSCHYQYPNKICSTPNCP